MSNKNKENSRVPKSDKTRLSDLTPKKDAPGGIQKPTGPNPGGIASRGGQVGETPPGLIPPSKKHLTL
jgi:hypothetical protein